MKILLEEGAFLENQTKILNTLAEMKISHTLWNHKSYPPYDGKDKNVFFMGSYLTANNLKLAGYQYVLNIGKEYHYSNWSSNIKDGLFNKHIILIPAGLISNFSKILAQSFSKLNTNCGKLKGKVRTVEEIESGRYLNFIFNEDLVVLAPPQETFDEYRCVIKSTPKEDNLGYNYSIVTSSLYKRAGVDLADYTQELPLNHNSTLLSLLEKAEDFKPHKVFVCDVNINNKNELSIMNINSIHTSPLYGCDFKLLFDEVRLMNEA